MTEEIPQPIKDHIASLEAGANDQGNTPEHRSFLGKLLNVLYEFLPLVISLFHKSGGTQIPGTPPVATPAGGGGAAPAPVAGVDTGSGSPAGEASASGSAEPGTKVD